MFGQDSGHGDQENVHKKAAHQVRRFELNFNVFRSGNLDKYLKEFEKQRVVVANLQTGSQGLINYYDDFYLGTVSIGTPRKKRNILVHICLSSDVIQVGYGYRLFRLVGYWIKLHTVCMLWKPVSCGGLVRWQTHNFARNSLLYSWEKARGKLKCFSILRIKRRSTETYNRRNYF